MQDILHTIVAHKYIELEEHKQILTPSELYRRVDIYMASDPHTVCSMKSMLESSDTGIIAEFKRKSPSKGWIYEDAEVETTVKGYTDSGASALSILTDNEYFGGDLRYINRARSLTPLPILRKDFIVDEYQLFQARLAGADAVLLIAAVLTKEQYRSLAHLAHDLGLEVLLETHHEHETEYIDETTDMVGVNNRHLGTFSVDVANSLRMLPYLPTDRILVSESGIGNARTVADLRRAGYRGFLIGETFMKTGNPGKALQEFIENLKKS